MIVREYLCPDHGRFELIESSNLPVDDGRACPECGAIGEWAISAPRPKMHVITVERGGVAPKPSPWALDTRPIADGMSHGAFREKRKAEHRARRRVEIKSKL